MDEQAAILSAVAAYPADDTPRLAYADWLDDHADDLPDPAAARTRAEFVRVQCEVKRLEDDHTSTQLQGYADLYRRQDDLLTRHRRDLLGPLGDDLTEHDVVFDRGFPAKLTLDIRRFYKHAAAIAALTPRPDVCVTGAGAAPSDWRIRQDAPPLITELVMHQPGRAGSGRVSLRYVFDLGYASYPRLRDLSLEGCDMGDEGLRWLADVGGAFPALTRLDLSGNEISDTGVLSLVNSPLWPRLTYLVLGANPISDEGARTLADAPPTALANLNVRFTGIGPAGQHLLLRRKGWKVDLF